MLLSPAVFGLIALALASGLVAGVFLTFSDFVMKSLIACAPTTGTGMLAIEAAHRGADVVAIDLSEALIDVAKERTPADLRGGSIAYHAGDMTDPGLGSFDYVVAMDSFIHYPLDNVIGLLDGFAARTRESLLFTFAPKTPMLTMMHASGQLFPRDNRSPAIVPVAEKKIASEISKSSGLGGFGIKHMHRISTTFYKSQAMELLAK